MSPNPPFVDPTTGGLDYGQILSEAIGLAKLVGLFVGLALVPYTLLLLAFAGSSFGVVLGLLGQVILAIGAGIVLMYVIARGMQLAGE